jgi:hypothetical protein
MAQIILLNNTAFYWGFPSAFVLLLEHTWSDIGDEWSLRPHTDKMSV